MKYSVINQHGIGVKYNSNLVNCVIEGNNSKLIFRSPNDYSLFNEIVLEGGYAISSFHKDGIVLYNFRKEGFLFYRNDNKNIESSNSKVTLQYVWDNGLKLYLDREKKEFIVKTKALDIFKFRYKFPIVNRWHNFGILIFQNNEKENNWIQCLDPNGGKEKWRKELPWQFVRLETYKDLIILEYQAYDNIRSDKGYEGERDWYNPNRFTIAVDGETGEERWRREISYTKIDRESGVILAGNDRVVEVDLETGNTLTEVLVSPRGNLGYYPHFVDEEGIYYTTHQGAFGKVDKVNGQILWEFDLIDEKGEKRKLSDWLLLGNGNLVLQAMSNHPNGDLTCVLNPNENAAFSKVKEGIRKESDRT